MPWPPPWSGKEIAPFTPQKPIDRTTTQMSWFTRSRVVVSANPMRHMSRTFWKNVHLDRRSSRGRREKFELLVTNNEKSIVNSLCGETGGFFFPPQEKSQE